MSRFSNYKRGLLFDKRNFIVLGAGMVLVVLGFLLMAGGGQPDPNTWQPEEIYSSRRLTLAPFVVILGLCVVIVSIFLNKSSEETEETAGE